MAPIVAISWHMTALHRDHVDRAEPSRFADGQLVVGLPDLPGEFNSVRSQGGHQEQGGGEHRLHDGVVDGLGLRRHLIWRVFGSR
jgi:hypothetical protein